MEAGGETLEAARWSARAAYWAGSSRPQDALRLWRKVMELTEDVEESEETTAMAVMSRLLQLDYAWRLGMDKEEEARLVAEAEEIATATGDLRSLALLRTATSTRPGMPHHADSLARRGRRDQPPRRRIGRPAPAHRDPRGRLLRPPVRRRLRRLRTGARRGARAGRRRSPRRRRDRHRLPGRLGDDGQGAGAARARPARRGGSAVRRRRCGSPPSTATPRPPAGPAATSR